MTQVRISRMNSSSEKNPFFLERFPPDLIPDLVRERTQEKSQRTLRSRRSTNGNSFSSNKKRSRDPSFEGDEDDDDDDEKDSDRHPLKKRIRRIEHDSSSFDAMKAFKKRTRDRLAHKALDIDANPQENTSYKRFMKLLDTFNDDYERHHDEFEQTTDEHFVDLFLSRETIDEMARLSEKLKLSTYFSHVDLDKLKRLLEILAFRIQQGIELNPFLKHEINDEENENENEEDERAWRLLIFERLTICANACEIALNIMTTSTMSKEILMENVIEYTALFIKAQLTKTIFPEFDPLYRSDNQANGKNASVVS